MYLICEDLIQCWDNGFWKCIQEYTNPMKIMSGELLNSIWAVQNDINENHIDSDYRFREVIL